MFKQTLKTSTFFKRASLLTILAIVMVSSFVAIFDRNDQATAATSSTINFQARLLTAAGNLVPDGQYNVEFKLYNALTSSGSTQGSCTGDAACLWTETRTSGNKVRVVNGYLTVNLGSVTAFGALNWDQDMFLTMNVGGTAVSASWDGEMTPRLKLTAVPYAFRAGALAGGTGANVTVLNTGTPSGTNTISLPAESGVLCIQSSVNCGFLTGTAANYIQNQIASPQATSSFWLSGTGRAATALQAPLLDSDVAATALDIGTTNANAINLKKSTTVTGNLNQSTGTVSLASNGNASYTANGTITITAGGGSTWSTTSGNLTVQAATTNNLLLTTGGAGTVDIGGTTSTTINIGGSNNIARTINVGTGGTGLTQAVTIGSTSGASSLTLQSGTGNVTVKSAATANALQLITPNNGVGLNVDATTTNLITNPNMESGITGWVAKSGAAVTQQSTFAYDGNNSLRAVTTATAGDGTKFNYTLLASTQYSFSVFVRSSVTLSTIEIGYSSDGSTDTSCSTAQPSRTTYWTRLSCTFTTSAVSGTRYVYVKQTDAAIHTFYVDGAQLETAAAATVYRNTKTTLGGSLYINGGPNAGASATDALQVKALQGGSGMTVYGSGDNNIFAYAVNVLTADGGLSLFNVSDSLKQTSIIGGNAFFNTPALRVTTSDTGASALDINAAVGQTGDILRLYDGTAGTPLKVFSVASSGAVTIAPNAASANALRVQNTSGNEVFAVNTSAGQITLGKSSSVTGGILFNNGTNINTVTLQSGTTSTSYVLTLPTAVGTQDQCMKLSNGTGSLAFVTCGLQEAYNAGNTIATTDSRNLTVTLQDTATDSSFITNMQCVTSCGTNGRFVVQNAGTSVFWLNPGTAAGQRGSAIFRTTANDTAAFQVQDSSGTAILNVDTSTDTVSVVSANALTNSQNLLVQQTSTGDSGIEIKNPSTSYYIGVDSTDSKFKINSSAGAGAVTMGFTTKGATVDSGDANTMNAIKFTASVTGTISTLYGFVDTVDASGTTNKGQMAIYGDNGSGTAPAAKLNNSAAVALSPVAWNAFPITTTNVTAGTVYWLVYNTNSASGLNNLRMTAAAGTSRWVAQTYNTWPTWSGGTAATDQFSMYAPIRQTGTLDNFNASALTIDTTGATTFRNGVDSAGAFDIQNASGNSLFKVDTVLNQVTIGVSVNGPGGQPKLLFGDNCSSTDTCVSIFEGATLGGTVGGDTNVAQMQGGNGIRLSTGAGKVAGLTIDSSQQVGIGTETPSEALTVNGNFNVRNSDTPTKALRWRTDGASIDFETGGSGTLGDLYISGWINSSMTGTPATNQVNWFRMSSSTRRVSVGAASTSTTPTTLALDRKSDAGDPAGVAGAMYYNDTTTRFRCYENGAWNNCINAAEVNGSNGVSATGTIATGAATSYANMPSPSSTAFTKKFASTKLAVQINATLYTGVAFASTGTTVARVGVNIGGTDYDCGQMYFNLVGVHEQLSCSVVVTGQSAGSKTAQMRWKRITGGTAAINMDASDWASMTVTESD